MVENRVLFEIVNKALDMLYDNDYYLFINNSSEKNLVFHFSRYLIELLKSTGYERLSVDCEYNRNALNEKGYKEIVYEHKFHRIFPDVLLHERGTNRNNILAIEFKKNNNKNTKNDFYKLKALTDNEGEFKYHMGLFIRFGKRREEVCIKIFQKGKII